MIKLRLCLIKLLASNDIGVMINMKVTKKRGVEPKAKYSIIKDVYTSGVDVGFTS